MGTQVGSVAVEIVHGDICTRDVDAIVNAANDHLWMGGGVAGAIKRLGGSDIEREATTAGPIAVGQAVATTAGRLSARHVIHAAVMGQDLATDGEKIRLATEATLALADRLRLRSIAFPALGTGVGGFSLKECAGIMLDAVRAHAAKATTLQRVEFVLFTEEAHEVFAQVLNAK